MGYIPLAASSLEHTIIRCLRNNSKLEKLFPNVAGSSLLEAFCKLRLNIEIDLDLQLNPCSSVSVLLVLVSEL